MRKTALALVVALAASLASFVPGSAAVRPASAASNPKVVIIVGATHSTTSKYRSYADVAYAEAIKYTSNVVKVYSPNATWAAVKSAIQGASIVIYMGHGNGFPSPYRTTPWPYSQNGFGLNKVAGAGDDNVQYFGEYYIGNEVKLAPNAVVLLHHLCYASGNSEPGLAEPTLSVAKQRADNYAAGFLKAGARAVIADGHMGPSYYIRSLFTTRQTLDQLWRTAPNFHNHAFSFASVRSPGYTVEMDPDNATSGYYRALTGRLDLQTADVTGASYAGTDGDPAGFTVPGAASVGVDGAGLYGDAALTPNGSGVAPATLPVDTRLRVLASGVSSTGGATLQVRTLDGAATGWMAAGDLVPRDSSGPQVWESAAPAAFSPNADGRQDALTFTARLSEAAGWRFRVSQGDVEWFSASGSGTDVAATWDGRKSGATAPDGAYAWTLESTDAWGNAGTAKSGTVALDTVAPALAGVSVAADDTVTFSPNGDGRADTVAVGWQTSEAGAVDLTVRNDGGTTVRTASTTAAAGAGTTTWDGRSSSGAFVPDGTYTASLAPRDLAGNVGPAEERQVTVFASLSRVVSSLTRFYPQDGDRFAKVTKLSFTLARPATVTWRVLRRDGVPVYTRYENAALAAGTYSFYWYGKDQAGKYVPVGTYTSAVTATEADRTITQMTWVETNAFTIRPSDTTPGRGQSITVTAIRAEPVTGYIYLHVYQPGIGTWYVRMSKVSSTTWRKTIRLRSSQTGTVTFRVSGKDADGRWQASYLKAPLH